jgi:hypothetical protein
MHGTVNLKYIEAKQAKEVYQHKNIKQKLHKKVAAIWYNKLPALICYSNGCLFSNISPDGGHGKLPKHVEFLIEFLK